MQLAINVIIFFLGFSIAAFLVVKPKKVKEGSQDIFSGFRSINDNLTNEKRSQSPNSLEKLAGGNGLEPSNNTDGENLLTKEQIEEKYNVDTWQGRAYDDFKTTILAKGTGLRTFPCVYATMGYRQGDHRYVFLHSDDLSEPRNIRLIAPALRHYLRTCRSLGPNTSMVIMGAPTEGEQKTVEQYNESFWGMLRGLRTVDAASWPEDIPQETDDPKWTFCFDGQPLFPVSLTPAHQRRYSRHSAVPLIALQPKWVLDKLLSTPEKRESATSKVRKLLVAYDQTEVSPDLSTYGDVGTSEVHQLCLMDINDTVNCPYSDFDKGSATTTSSRRTSVEASSRRTSMEE